MACSDGESECPLCMESLEIDDIDFYPCKCEYQICRFCWHRIRTDENGLCPACRQPYPENPVNFKPISSADVRKHKDRKKQKQQAEKVKESESRQHLANYRVLQKNLMYVVGLSNKLLDLELLKKPEYFGRYGKILKMVTGTAPGPHVGAPPAQSVYVTYGKVEEALRAIQGVNNCYIDGRPVKASLGTTKYCSSFLQSKKCLKPDCMYLHEVAEPEISFTRDDMHAGKHADYEKRLSDLLLSKPPMTYNYLSQKVGPSKSYVTPAKDESAWPSMDEANRFGEEQENKQPVVASNEAEVMSQLAFNDSCSNDGSTVEDPAPSDVGNSKISQELKKVKQSVTRRRPERDTVMDQSHSPPSDPEGSTDRQVEDSLHRVNEILSEISKDEVSEEAPTPAAVRVEIPIYPQEEESSFGNLAPAPESGGDAPAPLTDWQSLLGFSMPQTSQNGLSLFAGPSTTTISAPTPTVPAPIKRPTPSAAPQTTAPFGLPPSSSSTLLSHAPSSVSPVASCRNPPPGLSKCTSDDDLGFDPFSESAKGLAQLLEEEEESPQPQSSHYSQSLSGLGNSLSQLSLFGQQHQMQTQNSLFQQMSAYGQPPSQQQQQQQSDLSGLHSLWNKPTQAPTAPSSTSSYLQAYQEQQRQLYLQQHRQQQQLLLQHLQQQQQQQHQQIGDNSLLRMLSQTTSSTVDPLQQLLQQQQQQQQQQSRMNQSEAMLQELARQRSSQLLRQQQQQQQQQQQYQRQSSAPQPQSSHPQGSLLHMLHSQQMQQQQQQQQQQQSHMQEKAPFGAPPGLASLQRQQSASAASTTSQMMPPGLSRAPGRPSPPSQQQTMTEWQEGFKALLPNVNVRFMNSSSSAEASSNAYEPTSIPRSAVPPPPGFR